MSSVLVYTYDGPFYDAGGREITLARWLDLQSDPLTYEIARDEVGPLFVQTVWAGFDLALLRSTEPEIHERLANHKTLIFETVIYGNPMEWPVIVNAGQKYSRLADAFSGHRRWVSIAAREVELQAARDLR